MTLAGLESARVAWRRLAPRERRLIAAGAALVAAVATYLLVLGPFTRSLAKLRLEVPQARAQLATMREQANLVEHLRRGSSARAPATKLPALAEQTAETHGLRGMITRIETEGTNGLRVALEGAPFNPMVAWLAELQQRSGLRVETAAIESHDTAGAVTARLLLRAQAP
jgi:general secretion pathway protein M